MNEQAQKLLISLVEKATSGIDAAVSFSQAQIPDVIQQMLMWKSTVSLIYTAFALLFFVLTVVFLCGAIKRIRKVSKAACLKQVAREKWQTDQINYEQFKSIDDDSVSEYKLNSVEVNAVLWTAGITVVGLVISFLFLDFDWVKIWIAPKFYLVEYATQLVK